MRVRDGGSESEREREICPKNHQRFPQNLGARKWTDVYFSLSIYMYTVEAIMTS